MAENRDKIKYAGLFIGCLIVTTASLAQEVAVRAAAAFARKPHTFTTITRYSSVQTKVLELADKAKVSIFTDWDDTINAPGAWRQTTYDGAPVCETTKRMLLEHEVDSALRDEDTAAIIATWKSQNVPVLVTTARPPIIDIKLRKYAQESDIHPNLMDIRMADQPDIIDYTTINHHISYILKNCDPARLREKTAKKITTMSEHSGIDLRGQTDLRHTVIKNYNGHLLTYHDGYAFIGHTKGPNMLHLIQDIKIEPGHLIIVDDSPRAIGSYLEADVITGFEQLGYTLHLMHYPIH